MGKALDLTGQKFGKLTCLEIVGKTKHGGFIWKCLCDCGKEHNASRQNLIKGDVKSCGCLKNKFVDITGLRFGRLIALEIVGRDRTREAKWLCQCDCGNKIKVRGSSLRTGNTKSCGCLHKDSISCDLTGQKFGKLSVIRKTNNVDKFGNILYECVCDCGTKLIRELGSRNRQKLMSCGCVKSLDLTGQRFGKLIAIKRLNEKANNSGAWLWECLCDCGNICNVRSSYLKNGHTKSCGCYNENKIHGMSGHKDYYLYKGMISRCTKPNHIAWHNYGGRGITVCERWADNISGFKNFLEDMGERPSEKYAIERIDNNKGYYKQNCKWILRRDQGRNKSGPHERKIKKLKKKIEELEKELSIHNSTDLTQQFPPFLWHF